MIHEIERTGSNGGDVLSFFAEIILFFSILELPNKRDQRTLFLKDLPIQVPGTKRQVEIAPVIRMLLLSTLFFFFSSLHTVFSQDS